MSFLEFVGYLGGGALGVFAVVRLGTAAYFLSRQQYEERKKHGTQPK